MDISGKAICLQTKICQLPITVDKILNIIIPSNLDGTSLNDALHKLDISFNGETDGTDKKVKCNYILNNEAVNISDVVHLHKASYRNQFQSMFLSYCLHMAQSANNASTPVKPNNSGANADVLNMLALNIQMMSEQLSNLPDQNEYKKQS